MIRRSRPTSPRPAPAARRDRPRAGRLAVGLLVLAAAALTGPLGPFGAAPARASVDPVAELPLQHEGRIKPLDTFARVNLLASWGKRSLPDEAPVEWLLDTIVDPEGASQVPTFAIRNPAVVDALELPEREKRHYSLDEITTGLMKHIDEIQRFHQKSEAERSLVENQIVEVYVAAIRHREIPRSMSCLTPDFVVHDPDLARALGLEPGQAASYLHFVLNRDGFQGVLERMESLPREEWGDGEREAMELASALSHRRHDSDARVMAIVPPEPGDVEPGEAPHWSAPWELLDGRALGPTETKVLLGWEKLLADRAAGDGAGVEKEARALLAVVGTGENGRPPESRLKLETWYNDANLFYQSLAFYILAFLLLAASWLGRKGVLLRRLSGGSLVAGVLLHVTGLTMRMIIMGRPPVSTLYESVVFVGCVAALSGSVVEGVRRDGLGIFVGATIGAILHFIGFGYAADGDTLGMLVAVLNSNFWLATHVVTITIGYGTSIVAGLAGHVYLFWRIFRPRDAGRLADMNRNMVGLTLVALFFTLFGTILGGIWADQSWGRFWGWDPKENGALLIVMWQLLLLHGKVSGQFQPAGFAAGLVVNNIIVSLAWFGVNLLNVGLHSYGFTSHIAVNLAIFCGIELLFAGIAYPWARMRAVEAPSG